MIHVVATLSVDPARRDEVLKSFAELVPQVQAEDGCIEYGAAVDEPTGLPHQTLAGEGALVVIEKWESVEKLNAHLAAPHMEAFREANASIIQDIKLMVLQPAT